MKYYIEIGVLSMDHSFFKDSYRDADVAVLFVEANLSQVGELLWLTEDTNAQVEWAAISDFEDVVRLHVSEDPGLTHIVNPNFERIKGPVPGKITSIRTTTFSKLLDKYPQWRDAEAIDIDTEGMDTRVLKSMFEAGLFPGFVQIEDWDDEEIMNEQEKLFSAHNYVRAKKLLHTSQWVKFKKI